MSDFTKILLKAKIVSQDQLLEAEKMAQRNKQNVGDVLRLEGVPPMYTFNDPDGNRSYIVEEPR